MTTTTDTAPAETEPGDTDLKAEGLTLTEFIAQQLNFQSIDSEGRLVRCSAVADGTVVVIDIERPFPPTGQLRVLAQLTPLVPDDELPDAEIVDEEPPPGVEIGVTA